MRKYYKRISLLVVTVVLSSCVREQPQNSNFIVNFEALWKIIDERYCFLEEKGVDWDAIHDKYEPKVRNQVKNDPQFFYLMSEMLNELKDGHVNLVSPFDVSHNNDWMGDETEGLNIYARRKILGNKLMSSGGMKYNKYEINDRPDVKFGYISYGSFSGSIGNTDFMFDLFKDCAAIILDVRGNGGGLVENSDKLVSLFLKEKALVGYSSHKVGPERGNFSKPKELYVSPTNGKRWTDKPLIILQDRGCYSATNDFLYKVSVAPNVVRIGLPSGGGAGLPSSSELPNGWKVRYSAVKNYDSKMKNVEQGIQPDIYQEGLTFGESPAGPDLILLRALKYIAELNTDTRLVNHPTHKPTGIS